MSFLKLSPIFIDENYILLNFDDQVKKIKFNFLFIIIVITKIIEDIFIIEY